MDWNLDSHLWALCVAMPSMLSCNQHGAQTWLSVSHRATTISIGREALFLSLWDSLAPCAKQWGKPTTVKIAQSLLPIPGYSWTIRSRSKFNQQSTTAIFGARWSSKVQENHDGRADVQSYAVLFSCDDKRRRHFPPSGTSEIIGRRLVSQTAALSQQGPLDLATLWAFS